MSPPPPDIKGYNNDLANTLSQDNKDYFLSKYPQASLVPTPLPHELLDLIIKPDSLVPTPLSHELLDLTIKPDWTSAPWTGLWSNIFEVT